MTCTVCRDPRRKAIDAALLTAPAKSVATTFGFATHDALGRHRRNCLALSLQDRLRATRMRVNEIVGPIKRVTQEPHLLETPEDVLAEAREAYRQISEIAEESRQAGDLRTALFAAREMLGILTFFAKTFKMFDESVRVDASTKIVALMSAMTEDELRAIIARTA